jgi:hypothetical protein
MSTAFPDGREQQFNLKEKTYTQWNPPPSTSLEANADLSDFYISTSSAILAFALWSLLQKAIRFCFKLNGIIENTLSVPRPTVFSQPGKGQAENRLLPCLSPVP